MVILNKEKRSEIDPRGGFIPHDGLSRPQGNREDASEILINQALTSVVGSLLEVSRSAGKGVDLFRR